MRTMQNFRIRMAFTFALTLLASRSYAEGPNFPVQGRLFIGADFIKPTNVNTQLSDNGFQTLKNVVQYGAEVTFAVTPWLDFGGRYVRHGVDLSGTSSTTNATYTTSIRQDSVIFLARLPIVRTSVFKFDLFGGGGAGNTNFTVQTSGASTGSYSSSATWQKNPLLAGGASIGIGYKKVYFYIEGGYEQNKTTGMTQSGSLSMDVSSLDLSGPYVMIGLLFDGAKGSKK